MLLDLFYRNDRDRQLEGTFKLRLPDGASPYYFAFGGSRIAADGPRPEGAPRTPFLADEALHGLGHEPEDIPADRGGAWEGVREARMVPRDRAAWAYGEVVRRRVDPALMEWSGAGIFRARVFPLAPHASHRIVVGYDVDLTPAGDDLEYRLELPEAVPELAVDLRVAAPPATGVQVSPRNAAATERRPSRFHFANPEERTFTVRLVDPPVTAITTPASRDEDWFAVSFRPELPVEEHAGARRAVFLVDTSLSSFPDRMPVWLELLGSILERNRESLLEFAVLFFDVEPRWWRPGFTANTEGAVAELMDDAHALFLEGASDLGAALAQAGRPHWARSMRGARWDVFLLSDGAATWGASDPHALSSALGGGDAGALFAYTTGQAGGDRRALDHLARETGGAVFSVVGPEEVSAAAVAHRARPWRIEEVRLGGARDLLLAGRPLTAFPGQTLRLAGRGRPSPGDAIELVVSRGGVVRTVATRLGHVFDSELAPRAYGEIAVGQLEELGDGVLELARPYAVHFRVTGKTCSLLMLESEEDYGRYGIEPEQDAGVVRATEVAGLVREALASIGLRLGDPKSSFLAFLERLEDLPGVELRVPEELRSALSDLSPEVFAIAPPDRSGHAPPSPPASPSYRAALSSTAPDYGAVHAEAARRLEGAGPEDALRALSSLVEGSPGDPAMARDVAFTALEWGLAAHAYSLFRRVADVRPYEPHAYPATARCLAELGRVDLALLWYEVALAGRWSGRYGDFRRVTALEYAHFLRMHSGALAGELAELAARRLEELSAELALDEADLLFAITWNTDRTDVDLHVVEPTGEECFFRNRQTKLGGRLTRDVTQGYGPELYSLERAAAGDYRVFVRLYSSDRNRTSATTKVYATVYERWGTSGERVTRRTVSLAAEKEVQGLVLLSVGGG